jgi:membrane protease YdiL (CAAX protease family)
MLTKAHVDRCFIIFAAAFGLRQAADYFNTSPYGSAISSLASLGIALIIVLLIGAERSGFGEHGFLTPNRSNRLLAISLFLAFLFALVAIFVPGGLSGFEALPGAPISWNLLFTSGTTLLAVIAAETVFRGYIQTDLENAYGFSVALTAVSIMFTLYMLPISLYSTVDSGGLIRLSLPFLADSIFLCYFFKETKTLLCPIAFATTVTLLETFTPLVPTSSEYTSLVSLVCYIFMVPIMQSFMQDVREQNARNEPVPEVEPE